MLIDIRPNITKALLPVSSKMRGRVIECDLARTLTVTGRCTYNASGTAALRVNLYYSPDGVHFDTVPYTYFDLNVTAGSEVQESALIDPPEVGYLVPEIENLDASYTITDITIWETVSRHWEDIQKAVMPGTKRL
jgi:hypothetical protein